MKVIGFVFFLLANGNGEIEVILWFFIFQKVSAKIVIAINLRGKNSIKSKGSKANKSKSFNYQWRKKSH